MLIAQITDMHITVEDRFDHQEKSETHKALAACLAHVTSLDPCPDVVLFTGDLTDTGSPQDYALLKEMLEGFTLPYLMIPGNHDTRRALRAAFPEATGPEATGPEATGLEATGGGELAFVQYAIDTYPLRLVGLDTSEPGQPHGVLCRKRLDWLQSELQQETQKPRMLFMHHPPFKTGMEYVDSFNLKEGGKEFGEMIAASNNIMAVVCGHVHRSVQTLWNGKLVSIAPSPSNHIALDLRPGKDARLSSEPLAYHLHKWSPQEGFVTHLSYVDT